MIMPLPQKTFYTMDPLFCQIGMSLPTNADITPNQEYWDKDVVKLETANVQVIKTPSTAVNLFESGEVDVVNKLSSEFRQKLQR